MTEDRKTETEFFGLTEYPPLVSCTYYKFIIIRTYHARPGTNPGRVTEQGLSWRQIYGANDPVTA